MAHTITPNDFGVYAECSLASQVGNGINKIISIRTYFHQNTESKIATKYIVDNFNTNESLGFEATEQQSAIDKYNSIGN